MMRNWKTKVARLQKELDEHKAEEMFQQVRILLNQIVKDYPDSRVTKPAIKMLGSVKPKIDSENSFGQEEPAINSQLRR